MGLDMVYSWRWAMPGPAPRGSTRVRARPGRGAIHPRSQAHSGQAQAASARSAAVNSREYIGAPGLGERGNDNEAQLKHGVKEFVKADVRKKYPCFLIAPQCPARQVWAGLEGGFNSHKQAAKPAEPGRLVLELIGAMQKEYSIDPKRIYLTGLSMGGYGTWDLLARQPKLFAAGVPVCGGGDESTAEKIAQVPIWVFHGDKDNAVPVARSRTMVEALKKAGGHPKYTEYPGVGHNSWDKAYADPELMKWLFAQKRS
jgi:predicted peptidase